MAQFRATIRGQRGEASRLGSAKSGMCVECNGWNGGVSVEAGVSQGEDYFVIYATKGSNQYGSPEPIGTVNGRGEFTPASAAK